MFQNNQALLRKILRVGAVSGLTGFLLTSIIRGRWYTRFMLIAITSVSLVVLLFWFLNILTEHKVSSKKIKEKGMIAILSVSLFLLIQYFLVGVFGERISRNDEQAAIEYCELIGKKAEEFKNLNGDYPRAINPYEVIEIWRPRLILSSVKYLQSRNHPLTAEGPYCEFSYFKESFDQSKVYIIPDKKWVVYVNR